MGLFEASVSRLATTTRYRNYGTHVPTYPRTHVPTYPRTHVPTYPRTHVPTYPRTHVPTYPRTHVTSRKETQFRHQRQNIPGLQAIGVQLFPAPCLIMPSSASVGSFHSIRPVAFLAFPKL
jgi:hypothetical protein